MTVRIEIRPSSRAEHWHTNCWHTNCREPMRQASAATGIEASGDARHIRPEPMVNNWFRVRNSARSLGDAG